MFGKCSGIDRALRGGGEGLQGTSCTLPFGLAALRAVSFKFVPDEFVDPRASFARRDCSCPVPQTVIKKATARVAFFMIGWGRGITRAIPALAPSGPSSLRFDVQIRSRRICRPPRKLRLTGLLLPSPPDSHKKSHREGGFFYDWLGERDEKINHPNPLISKSSKA